MPQEINLKIYGVSDPSDLKLMEGNLRSQEDVKSLRFFLSKNYAEIKAEIEPQKISKQQFVDIIKLGGDLKIEDDAADVAEEFAVEKRKVKKVEPVSPKAAQVESVLHRQKADSSYQSAEHLGGFNVDDAISEMSQSKRLFLEGFLVGFAIISLLLNIALVYLIITKGGALSARKPSTNIAAAAKAQPAPKPSPSAEPTGNVQSFNITKADHVRGTFDAPITLVEYSDFECPYCGRHYPTLKKILSDYKGKVRLVYKHFPLSFHPNSQKAAEAAECASEQGKFWEYHDKLFDEQVGGFSVEKFKQWADDLGLKTSKFNDCLDSDKYAGKVASDEADGQQRGVNGTPATFVNGQLVSGALPYESFKSVIEQILKSN